MSPQTCYDKTRTLLAPRPPPNDVTGAGKVGTKTSLAARKGFIAPDFAIQALVAGREKRRSPLSAAIHCGSRGRLLTEDDERSRERKNPRRGGEGACLLMHASRARGCCFIKQANSGRVRSRSQHQIYSSRGVEGGHAPFCIWDMGSWAHGGRRAVRESCELTCESAYELTLQ